MVNLCPMVPSPSSIEQLPSTPVYRLISSCFKFAFSICICVLLCSLVLQLSFNPVRERLQRYFDPWLNLFIAFEERHTSIRPGVVYIGPYLQKGRGHRRAGPGRLVREGAKTIRGWGGAKMKNALNLPLEVQFLASSLVIFSPRLQRG